MKKLLSILLALIVIVTSCVCGITVSAADCSNGHNVISYTSQNENYHFGKCSTCQKIVKRSHNIVYDREDEATCTEAGYVYYKCEDCDYTESTKTTRLHNIIKTEYIFFLDNNNNNTMCKRIDYCSYESCYGEESEPYMAGATNYCPECRNGTVIKKTVYYPSCTSIGKTVYECTTCGDPVEKDKLPKTSHTYESVIEAPDCTKEGCIKETCINCGEAKNNGFVLLQKEHRLDVPGQTYTYTYSGEDCEIKGLCADCGNPKATVVKKYVVSEKCSKCEKNITSKDVTLPSNCDGSAQVTYKCSSCSDVTVQAVPVGHSAKKTSYYYQDGVFDYAEVDCYKCGTQVINDDSFKNKTTCRYCSGNIIDRVVIEPTCTSNGYTKVACGDCGRRYTEDSVVKKSHSVTEAKWVYNYAENLSVYSILCENYGCSGDTYENRVAVTGTCPECNKNEVLVEKREIYSDCISKGYTVYKCEICSGRTYDEEKGTIVYGDLEKANTVAKSHTNVTEVTEASCTEEGYTKSTCKDCYHTAITSVVPQKNHDFYKVTYTYENGSLKVTPSICRRCGEKPEPYSVVGNLGICKKNNCTAVVVKKEYQAVSCASELNGMTEYTCSLGHETIENIIPYEHKYGIWVVEKYATCVTAGLKVKTCSVCSKRLEAEIDPNTNAEGEPLHSLVVFVEGKEPTCTEAGYTAETFCVWCGEQFDSKPLPATGHRTNPLAENKNYCTACNNYIIIDQNGEGKETPCNCIHHNQNPLGQVFFKILLFFCQIFGINRVCDCGEVHY